MPAGPFQFPDTYALIEREKDYASEANEDLLSVFKDLPRIEAFVDAYANRLTSLEELAFKAGVLMTDLDAAASEQFGGEWLRRLAVLADQPREGKTNATWAAFIRARMAAHLSRGTEYDLVTILRLLFGSNTAFREDEHYPKGAALYVLADLLAVAPDVDPVAAGRLLGDARDAGVRLNLVYSSGHDPEDDGLRWGYEADPAPAPSRHGLSSVHGGVLPDIGGTGWTEDLDTFTAGQADPLGGTGAYLLGDGSATVSQALTNSGQLAAENGHRYHLQLYVKKDAVDTRFPTLGAAGTVGQFSAGINFDTTSGGFNLVDLDDVDDPQGRVSDAGDWWRVELDFRANADAANVAVVVIPAYGSVLGTPSVAATGSITAYLPEWDGPGGRWSSVVRCRR